MGFPRSLRPQLIPQNVCCERCWCGWFGGLSRAWPRLANFGESMVGFWSFGSSALVISFPSWQNGPSGSKTCIWEGYLRIAMIHLENIVQLVTIAHGSMVVSFFNQHPAIWNHLRSGNLWCWMTKCQIVGGWSICQKYPKIADVTSSHNRACWKLTPWYSLILPLCRLLKNDEACWVLGPFRDHIFKKPARNSMCFVIVSTLNTPTYL